LVLVLGAVFGFIDEFLVLQVKKLAIIDEIYDILFVLKIQHNLLVWILIQFILKHQVHLIDLSSLIISEWLVSRTLQKYCLRWLWKNSLVYTFLELGEKTVLLVISERLKLW